MFIGNIKRCNKKLIALSFSYKMFQKLISKTMFLGHSLIFPIFFPKFSIHPILPPKKHILRVHLVGGMKKWEDRKNFIFSPFCLVGSEKVEEWKK